MRLHVITAISRPENLPRVAETLMAATVCEDLELCWHWRFDLHREHVGGQQPKNKMIGGIREGWVWILDDDTVVHPELFARFAEALEAEPFADAFIVAQKRSDGRVLHADRLNAHVGGIDAGQAILRRKLIGAHRIPEVYDGDGRFLQAVLRDAKRPVFLDEELCFHNALVATG